MDDRNEWCDGFELTPIGAQHKKYKWINDKMSKTIVEHNGKKIGGYEIVEVRIELRFNYFITQGYSKPQVYHVKNSELWEKYRTRRREIWHDTQSKVKEVRLFHGTNKAEQIAQDGFKIELSNSGGMFGKGKLIPLGCCKKYLFINFNIYG
jgi:hypothetical protein